MEPKVVCVLLLAATLAASSLAQGPEETCDVSPKERANCGHDGITARECRDKGCCFDDSVRKVPWCFYPQALPDEDDCLF